MIRKYSSVIAFAVIGLSMMAQTADNRSVNASWALTQGTGNESAVFTPAEDGNDFIVSTEMTVGSELTVKGESGASPIAVTYDGYTQTFFCQGTKTTSATDNNAIMFMLQPKEGITFTPTKVGLKVARWLTDKCKVDVSWVNDDGTKTVLATGITPNRNYNPDKGTGNIEGCSILDYDVPGSKASEGLCGIRVNVYGMNSGKTVSIGDVYVEGLLNGTVGQAITFTLKVSANPAGAGTITVTPAGSEFEKGQKVTLSQEPVGDYIFNGWYDDSENVVSSASTFQLVMDGNKNIVARYSTKEDLMKDDYIIVPSGNIEAFRAAIKEVNKQKDGQRRFIFLQDGVYDYGTFVSSEAEVNKNCGRDSIFVDNVSIIGQSREGVVVQIQPTMASVSRTAPIVIMGNDTYLQDFTLKNNFSYSGSDGQAAALMDLGHHTIGKNMLLLSKQDTYYPNSDYGQLYWETSEIHGTVDFICGRGDVYFNRCDLIADQRYANAYSGDTHIAAPYTIGANFDDRGGHGFIFESCYIDCKSKTFDFGRGWRGYPRMAYLNSTFSADAVQRIGVDMSTGKAPDNTLRFTTKGIQSSELPAQGFFEYNTMDEQGNVISPASNVLTFTASGSLTYETILQESEIEKFALRSVFTDWQPDQECRQIAMSAVTLSGNKLRWSAEEDAKAYLIECDGIYVTIVDGLDSEFDVTGQPEGVYTVRAANMRGGFGEAMKAGSAQGSVDSVIVDEPGADDCYYNVMGQRVGSDYKGVVIKNGKKYILR